LCRAEFVTGGPIWSGEAFGLQSACETYIFEWGKEGNGERAAQSPRFLAIGTGHSGFVCRRSLVVMEPNRFLDDRVGGVELDAGCGVGVGQCPRIILLNAGPVRRRHVFEVARVVMPAIGELGL